MVVQFHLEGVSVLPDEAEPPALGNANAVPAVTVADQPFEAISRRHSKIIDAHCIVDPVQLAPRPLQLIVATELTSNASDQGAMVGLLDQVNETFDAQPGRVLADAGYCNQRDLSVSAYAEIEAWGIDGYVAPGREGEQVVDKDAKTHPATHRMADSYATLDRKLCRASGPTCEIAGPPPR